MRAVRLVIPVSPSLPGLVSLTRLVSVTRLVSLTRLVGVPHRLVVTGCVAVPGGRPVAVLGRAVVRRRWMADGQPREPLPEVSKRIPAAAGNLRPVTHPPIVSRCLPISRALAKFGSATANAGRETIPAGGSTR